MLHAFRIGDHIPQCLLDRNAQVVISVAGQGLVAPNRDSPGAGSCDPKPGTRWAGPCGP